MTDQPPYPYSDGSRAVLGPDVYATADAETIEWQGAVYRRNRGEAPDPAGLRERLIDAITYEMHSGKGPFAVIPRIATAVLTTLQDHLDIGDAEAWCKTCRRVWDGPRHCCESDAEQRLDKIRDLRDDLRGITGARWIADALDTILDGRHDNGPSVREAADNDRRWPLEKTGE